MQNGIGQSSSLWSTAAQLQKGRYIDQIPTQWTAVERMPEEPSVRQQLLLRYYGAVHRYLLRVLRSPDKADDLAQEFAVRFLNGFGQPDRRHGRFRDYVKAAVCNLIADYHRRLKPVMPLGGVPEPFALVKADDNDRLFLESWREQLLTHAWDELALVQERTGQPFHTVLRLRADHPDLHSPQMAEQLSVLLGKPVNANWVRQVLLRARTKFGDLLLDDLVQSLERPTAERLEQELNDLGLGDHCQGALDRWCERQGIVSSKS
jgi:DNA-directed RNA polymerase specialized sigma24 family protein